MSETIKLCAMLARAVFENDDEAREPFVEQAMRAKREHDEMRRELAEARVQLAVGEKRATKNWRETEAIRSERHDLTNEVMHLRSLVRRVLSATGQMLATEDLPVDRTDRTRLLNAMILDAFPSLWESRHATGRAAGLLEAAAKLAELRDEWEVMMGDGSVAHNCGKIAHGHVIALAPPAAETVKGGA